MNRSHCQWKPGSSCFGEYYIFPEKLLSRLYPWTDLTFRGPIAARFKVWTKSFQAWSHPFPVRKTESQGLGEAWMLMAGLCAHSRQVAVPATVPQQFLCRSPGSPLTSVLPWKATSHAGLFLPATSWEPGQACVECACVCLWLGEEGALWDADLREDFLLQHPRAPPAPPRPDPRLCSDAGPCEPTALSLTRPLGLPTQTCLGLRGTPGLVGCSAVAGLRFLMIFEQGASHFYLVPDPDNVALNAVTSSQAPACPQCQSL